MISRAFFEYVFELVFLFSAAFTAHIQRRHGEGHLVYTSGDEYKGHFHGGVYGGGDGELICGDFHYVGEWRDGKRCGKGRCVLSNCDLYDPMPYIIAGFVFK